MALGLVYLDTNIVVSCFLCAENVGTPVQVDLARRFLDRCVKNGHTIVISSIILSELAGVCQKIATNRPEVADMEDRDEMIRYVRKYHADLFERVLNQLDMIPGVLFIDTAGHADPCMFEESLGIINNTDVIPYRKGRFKRFGSFDAVHLVFARRIDCTGFYTMDEAFGMASYGGDIVHVLDPDRPDEALGLL